MRSISDSEGWVDYGRVKIHQPTEDGGVVPKPPKPRVYEIASEFGVSTEVVLEKLATLGEPAPDQFSPLQPEVTRKLRAALEESSPGQATRAPRAPLQRALEAVSRRVKPRKPRVHEVADELGIDSRVALAKLKELGEFVKSPSSTLQPPVARKLRAAIEANRSIGSTATEAHHDPVPPSSGASETRAPTPAAASPPTRPAKSRVHEVASEFGVDSSVALAKLKELGEFVRSPSSTLEPPVARKLRAALEADGAAHLSRMGVVAELSPSLSGVDARQQGAESTRPGPRPRVHELAAELGVDIAIVFAKLRDLGEPARNPSSALDPSVAVKVRAELRGG